MPKNGSEIVASGHPEIFTGWGFDFSAFGGGGVAEMPKEAPCRCGWCGSAGVAVGAVA